MHIPVLKKEVIEYLDPKPNQNFIDCTVGGGGHTSAILEKTFPNGKVLGIDRDPKQIENCGLENKELGERLILVCDNFVNLKEIVEKNNFGSVSGILMDLGMSSWHLESERGFSFMKDEPLNMRYDADETKETAKEIINEWSAEDLERIFREYGEERFSEKIAEKIIERRKRSSIQSTFQLIEIIKQAVPRWYCKGRRHCATKVFQALRIAVNLELENIEKALPQALEILERGGRFAIISFHSLEDRMIKNFFREKKKEGVVEIITKKAVMPEFEEIKINNKSRSAKLRVAQKK